MAKGRREGDYEVKGRGLTENDKKEKRVTQRNRGRELYIAEF